VRVNTWRFFWNDLWSNPLTLAAVLLSLIPLALGLVLLISRPHLFRILLRNLGRNRLRTLLTSVAILFFVFIVIMIWTVVFSLAQFTRDRETNFKLIITERWSLPSMMPLTHADYLNPKSPKFILGDIKDAQGRPAIGPNDFMTWSFYGGTTDPNKITTDTIVFFFVMDPDQIRPMMDDLENLDPELIRKMKENRQGVLIGPERLARLNKRVGERFKLTSLNYKGIDLEVEVVGQLPSGRYGQSAIMNAEYFNQALDNYKVVNKQPHPLDNRRLNLIWLRVPDKNVYAQVAKRIEDSPYLTNPQVKCETASSGVSSFLEPYANLLLFVEYVLVPAILIIMALVIANAIGISVRERYPELAVLKVLGFRPSQILILVLGESLLIGGGSGLLSAALTFAGINGLLGGVRFPVAFFPSFPIPIHALWWGLAAGFSTAFLGSILPAWSARSVRVAEVFARVA
jgi:putative ABC transport system permease protein